ncbi:hypothetical protein GUJ93_ZPchr0003g16658 [Zizania palustris]|uniref:Uncharacterized protein n=1 Tax=Zizania palustris TaxID=103762 RepID=A0A8J5SD24_ZIZPA|nr:hypothetical protein GUJ93_ZPchr0003g16658 [Zizania palustris]
MSKTTTEPSARTTPASKTTTFAPSKPTTKSYAMAKPSTSTKAAAATETASSAQVLLLQESRLHGRHQNKHHGQCRERQCPHSSPRPFHEKS